VKIAIIGSGSIGSTAARLFVAAGHEVMIANRRGPDSLRALELELGQALRAGTVLEAARFGEVVLVAVPFGSIGELPTDAFAGKVVIDANNYYPDRDGHLAGLDSGETTSSQLLAQHLDGARVIKALNTMYFATLAQAGDTTKPPDQRLALFVAGDDAAAKQVVTRLIDQLGFTAVDTGGLDEGGRLQQPGAAIYDVKLTGAQAQRASH